MIPIQKRRHLECPVSQHDTMEPSSVGPTKMVALSPLYPGYPQKDDLLKFPVVHLFWEPNWPWFSMLMQLSVPVISAKPSWGFTGNSNFWMPQPHFDHAKYRKQALLNQPLWVGQGVTMQISAARACWDHHMAPDGRHTGKTQAFPQVLLLLFFVWGEGLLRSPKTEAPKYQNILLWRKSKCATMLGTGDVHFSSPRTGGTLCAWSPVKNARLFGIKYRDPATQCCPKCHQRSLSWKNNLGFYQCWRTFQSFHPVLSLENKTNRHPASTCHCYFGQVGYATRSAGDTWGCRSVRHRCQPILGKAGFVLKVPASGDDQSKWTLGKRVLLPHASTFKHGISQLQYLLCSCCCLATVQPQDIWVHVYCTIYSDILVHFILVHFTCMYIYIYVCFYIYIYICVCMYVFIYIHTTIYYLQYMMIQYNDIQYVII